MQEIDGICGTCRRYMGYVGHAGGILDLWDMEEVYIRFVRHAGGILDLWDMMVKMEFVGHAGDRWDL